MKCMDAIRFQYNHHQTATCNKLKCSSLAFYGTYQIRDVYRHKLYRILYGLPPNSASYRINISPWLIDENIHFHHISGLLNEDRN